MIAGVAPRALPRLTGGTTPSFDKAMTNFTHAPGTMMIHLALDSLPDWAAGAELKTFAYVHLAPSLDQMARTYAQAQAGILPDEPAELYAALEAAVPPKQTMAFVNYYKAGEVYPNEKPTVAVLLTAPADGKTYDINSPWVRSELDRISRVMGLDTPIDELFEDHLVLTPEYFGEWGSALGALYGKTHPLWQSGPFHNPQYRSIFRPWLRRVGASVHPGGGIPAVLGGTLISLRDLKPTI